VGRGGRAAVLNFLERKEEAVLAMTAERKRLPDERPGFTHKFAILGGENGRVKGYITVGLFENGQPGEIFIKMDQQGSGTSGFVDAWAIAVSMLLQTGTPLETICNKFRGMSFPPNGMTENEKIRIAKSPIDYVCRWLEMRFVDPELGGDE
jgi:ribonucleoside-diphosphate reductase alpha chain